jgi:hypothetical protein
MQEFGIEITAPAGDRQWKSAIPGGPLLAPALSSSQPRQSDRLKTIDVRLDLRRTDTPRAVFEATKSAEK